MGKKGAEAERLVEAWLWSLGWTTHRAAATGMQKLPSGAFIVKSHDLFGALDILAFSRIKPGMVRDGTETWGLQVTTQTKRSPRRRKLEAHDWPDSWMISLVSHETTPDPAHRGRKLHFLKIEDLRGGVWQEAYAEAIDVKALEALRKERAAAKKAAVTP